MPNSTNVKTLPKQLIEIPEMRRINTVHFVGIGGAGMCGIAEVLANQGYTVTGSDIKESVITKRLESLGITVFIGHDSSNIKNADVLVVSSAIDKTNPEIQTALQARLPVVRRADMLGELMRYRHSIAVAGAHGKTTTTSLLTMMLTEAGLDPTYVIGGKLNASGKNASLGSSRYLVAEADESDASFLSLRPMASIVTNIDEDHMDTYGGSFDKLKQAYIQFLHNMPFYGLAVVCGDDDKLYGMIDDIARPVLTFGFKEHNDVQAVDVVVDGTRTHFTVLRKDREPLRLTLNIPGEHNVLNALGAITLATDEGVDDEAIVRAVGKFAGVGRRFEQQADVNHDGGNILLVDDYGHHPAEVQATIRAARQSYPDRRLVMMFQPHRYSRTRDCFSEFVNVLSQVDKLVLLDVYSAGEEPIKGASSNDLARSLRERGQVEPIVLSVNDKEQIAQVLKAGLQPNDLLITQGAGNVGQICLELRDNNLYL
ncbi:UDP-N-acetylmuramate--L-alanine ligase [Moraxella bovis]|uniref:UDP-N-acetylmuramate--L-alanine ligase n=1 Tax=Moraxella bovis TaxID=476 RepID=UPI002226AD55|nr:UDP-N-acetylmuramate--L-alanine ligase [Moraxella bovis]UYZ71445.1 UDP-N-acetylmuramate--L-alanine ligase [Moraxella bovis]UYZ72642.1 UDP-N-acetylmuramate--L-alanine ligase [Moraxella bovis]UYZ88833.1 UDP-N-acetylmuramate--L-alanine ligase [Moraxella bovis]UZA14739.1 UDP-N-acetylmuramate--L-alanine ligase [Moraxella bovis]UZA42520.1 UDP-N-acetylmuramate--L-alanine ligase [Moraxella bovis]